MSESDKQRQSPSAKALVLALLSLLALTGLSWWLATLSLGAAAYPVALGIALVKATIVGAWFMELLHARRTLPIIALLTFGFIALICLGMAADVALR